MKKEFCCGVLSVFFVMTLAVDGLTGSLEPMRILKVSPQDHTAVVKTPKSRLRLVKVGDVLADNARVVEISAKRMVLEQAVDRTIETVMIHFDGKSQRIERYSKNPGPVPRLTMSLQ